MPIIVILSYILPIRLLSTSMPAFPLSSTHPSASNNLQLQLIPLSFPLHCTALDNCTATGIHCSI